MYKLSSECIKKTMEVTFQNWFALEYIANMAEVKLRATCLHVKCFPYGEILPVQGHNFFGREQKL
jgi:hypothetical protein